MSMTPYEWSLRGGGPANEAGNAGINPSYILGHQQTTYHDLLIAKDADFLQALAVAVNSTTNVDYFKTAGVFSTPNAPSIPGTTAPSPTPPAFSSGDNAGSHQGSSWGLGIS